jgi:ABC-type nickel/cobalt efflux system permease component RcnA
MTTWTVLFLGFLLGMRHATEADHLAAVASLATRQQSLGFTVRLGVAWGVGHTITLLLLGGAVLAMGSAVPAWLEQVLELAVGLMLVLLGADVLRRLVRQKIHLHAHAHAAGVKHLHAHPHEAGPGHDHAHALPLRALAVGLMHGTAGSAALVVLSLGAVQSWQLGLLYIALFGAGSILGMALLSMVIVIPLRWSAAYARRAHAALTAGIGVSSLGLGAVIVWQAGIAGAWAG